MYYLADQHRSTCFFLISKFDRSEILITIQELAVKHSVVSQEAIDTAFDAIGLVEKTLQS